MHIIEWIIIFFRWASLITTYVAFLLGLFVIWNWLILEVLVKQVLVYCSLYSKFVTWIFDMAEFKRWRKNKNKIDQ